MNENVPISENVRYTGLPMREKAYANKHSAEEPFFPPHWKEPN